MNLTARPIAQLERIVIPQTQATPPTLQATPVFTDILVAIHGIGDQKRSATVRSVATRLAGTSVLVEKPTAPGTKRAIPLLPVAPQPLGHFTNLKEFAPVLVDDASILKDMALEKIGFAEVFWANIPEEAVAEGHTLEETKEWARTVVARAQSLCLQARANGRAGIVPPDFSRATEVLEEIIDTVHVLENLTFLAEKAGLGSFDLGSVLEDYLGDVQIVAEFRKQRAQIVGEFRRILKGVYDQQVAAGNPEVRLHVVAHSEGTVVSFLGLLEAMSEYPAHGQPPGEATRHELAWLEHVRGFMTIGSPIDKHLLLWPRLWTDLAPKNADAVLKPGQIAWRNYSDYGDPVGFRLETARRWLDLKQSKAFEFCGCPRCNHDMTFARYPLPGKAHNDYWDDAAVFEHFVNDVVKPTAERPKPPGDKLVGRLSPLVPYALSAGVLAVASFLLYRTVTNFSHPERDPFTALTFARDLQIRLTDSVSGAQLLRHSLGVTGLLAGLTLLARLPRIAAGWRWKAAGLAAFALGCLAYYQGVDEASRNEIGRMFEGLGANGPTIGVMALALIVATGALWGSGSGRHRAEERRHWLFRRGMRPLLLCGAIGVSWIVGVQVFGGGVRLTPAQRGEIEAMNPAALPVIEGARFTADEMEQLLRPEGRAKRLETLVAVAPVVEVSPSVWPVALATAGFLYLWWLAASIFDLAFVWQRYVRNAVAVDRLSEWEPYGLPASRAKPQARAEKCRKPPRG